MAQYQLVLINNSKQAGNLIVYQRIGNDPNSVAWFSKYAYPGMDYTFQWDPAAFDFVWAGSGQLRPGIVFQASQVIPASLPDSNEITFSYDEAHRVFTFQNQRAGSQPNAFTIVQDSTIPVNGAAVGLGMSGNAILAFQAQPNVTVEIDASNLEYWVTFGSMQQGEYMNVSEIQSPVQVQFPTNVNSMTVTLNPDNTWTVEPNILLHDDDA